MKSCDICKTNKGQFRGKIQFGKNLCSKHSFQMKKYGKIIDKTKVTIFHKNKIIKKKNYALIILTNINHKKVGESKINLEDIDKIKNKKWTLSNTIGYVICRINNYTIPLHRYLLDLKKGDNKITDHINRDRLDNRRKNLRLTNWSGNSFNTTKRKNCSSKYKGVSYCKERNEWIAQISIDGKNTNLGRFKTEKEAIKKRLSVFNPEYLLVSDY